MSIENLSFLLRKFHFQFLIFLQHQELEDKTSALMESMKEARRLEEQAMGTDLSTPNVSIVL
jgi:hypothetical protein